MESSEQERHTRWRQNAASSSWRRGRAFLAGTRRARVLAALAIAAGVPALLIVVAAAPASAHVLKTAGPYHLLIGFGNEPTYAGAQNSVFLLLTNAKTGALVVDEGLGDTLKVEVGFGTQHQQLPLVSSFDPDSGQGTKGVYNAYFIPTAPGDYTFHFFGNIRKTKVNITVKSSPTTFDSAHDPAAIEFPQQAPSNAQLAQRMNAESARLSSEVHAASSTGGTAPTALAVGIAGLVVGVAGLCAAGLALGRGGRRSRRAAEGGQHPANVA
ncbi:MAG TPA: hypothetical protein VGG35_05960 [Streptosporangiaceae bacterium]